jgi:HAE1 family hydrophobic/amphiphilic exporter-1
MRRSGAIAVLLSLLATVSSQAQAANEQARSQDQTSDQTTDQQVPPRVGVDAPPAAISLDQVIRIALQQNPDVTIARLDAAASQQDVLSAQGVFDPRLTPSLLYERATTPTVSTIGGSTSGSLAQRELGASLGLTGRTPWFGTQFSGSFSSSRLETNNQFSRVNPQFPSSLALSVTQPLLRNLAIDSDRRQVLLARRAVDLSDAQLAQVTMEQLSLIEQAYWELTYAIGNVGVQRDALEEARTQVASNERQVEQGTLAVIDIVEARTQVATLEQSLASAQQAQTEDENRLKSLILSDRNDPMWNQPLMPTLPEDRAVPEVSVDAAIQSALTHRPELTSLAAQAAQNVVDQEFYRDQTRPALDLVGSYTMAGLAGTARAANSPVQNAADAALLARLNELSLRAGLEPLPTTPSSGGGSTVAPVLQGGLGASLSNVFAQRFPTVQVQMQLDLPLRNRTAEGNLARVEIQGRQLDQRRRQLEQSIAAEVRNALQRVASARQRLASASSAQRSAREQYDSERRRFDSGLSTVFLVLQRQTTLITAQGQELRARADLNQAVALFDRASGATLTHHGVSLLPTTP